MSLQSLALWFVCGFGTAILIAATPLSRAAVVTAAGAFVAGAWWAQQPFAPSPAAVALAAALMAVWQLVRAPRRAYSALVAGLLGGIWTMALTGQGLPPLAAIPAAAAVPVASAFLRHRSAAFAPPALVEEALIVLTVIGIAAAALPGIADGWRAAVNLSLQGAPSADAVREVTIPLWTLAVASTALLAGGLFSVWSRR